MLLARVGDLLSQWLWMNSDPEKRPATPPPPYPRPGVDAASNVRAISPGAQAYMDYMREHRKHPPDDWKPALA